MKVNQLLLSAACAFALGLASSPAAVAQSAPQTMPNPGAVAGGSAPIDQALPRIIPAPYRIALDQSVPASAQLVWQSGTNWMDVLRAAVAPLGLTVVPNWNTNTILIVGPRGTMPAAPAPASALTPTVATAALPPRTAAPVSHTDGQPVAPGAGAGCTTDSAHARWGCVVTPTAPKTATAAVSGTTSTLPAVKLGDAAGAPDVGALERRGAAFTIPAGDRLSVGLSAYAATFGWSVRWRVPGNFTLDAPFPIPASTLEDGVAYLIRAYQLQGELRRAHVTLRKPNRIVEVALYTAEEHQ